MLGDLVHVDFCDWEHLAKESFHDLWDDEADDVWDQA